MRSSGQVRNFFDFTFADGVAIIFFVTVETFRPELLEAMRAYDRYVICIDKIPAYESRGPQLRHGIALDKHVTVILSQNDTPRPLCGIYFNLHSPYQKQSLPKTVKPLVESVTEKQPE